MIVCLHEWICLYIYALLTSMHKNIYLSLEEFVVHVGHKVLMEVYNNSALIVGDPQGILGQQLWPHQVHFLNIIITVQIAF